MEQSEKLRCGAGQTFQSDIGVALAKALLQSGVSYVGSASGGALSSLNAALLEARPLLDELGVQHQPCRDASGAAAMLAASINYPLRGAASWSGLAGSNAAADAVSHLASAGVKGGAMLIVGEEHAEGAAAIQERSHGFALQSQLWLLDPRPDFTSIARLVEKGYELSEASNTPVMLALRGRTCGLTGTLVCKDNLKPKFSAHKPVVKPSVSLDRLPLPPANVAQEKHKREVRLPAALKFILSQRLNEVFDGDVAQIGIIVPGGLYNTVLRALQQLGLADALGATRIPLFVLNVTYPLVPEEVTRFCAIKRAVLVVEEGQPAYLEEAINSILRRADVNATHVIGKDVLPATGEYTAEIVLKGLGEFLRILLPDGVDQTAVDAALARQTQAPQRGLELLGATLSARTPGFCVGCPERPVFAALKQLSKELNGIHLSSDVGCHALSALPPFNLGNTVMGHGLALASSSGLTPHFGKRVVSVMGDGGFWQHGMSSVAEALAHKDDAVLIVLQNGDATGLGAARIARTLAAQGASWVDSVSSYDVHAVATALRWALTAPEGGLKIIIADGECALERARRVGAEGSDGYEGAALATGERLVTKRFGVDDELCAGDRSCIGLSGCPSLTIKTNPDELYDEPVATIDRTCVGCGVCGELAHEAELGPAFYHVEVIEHPSWWDKLLHQLRGATVGAGRAA